MLLFSVAFSAKKQLAGSEEFLCSGHSQFSILLRLLCFFSRDLGINLANFLANFESINAFSSSAYWPTNAALSGSVPLSLAGLEIGFSGAILPKPLPLSVARPINSPFRANKSSEIVVLSLNKAFSLSLIKGVLTTILLAGTYTKKVRKLSTAKRRPGSVLEASFRDLDLFLGGIKTSQGAPIIL